MSLYAIIDVETTGGQPHNDKIIEIAVVLHDGQKVIDKYESLVDPERSIPPTITRLTGISNEMVANAPKFYEIAKKLIELTEEAVFVAHNVRFDYNFVKEEYRRLGYVFTKKQLCTVRLSRQTFPGLASYSLGNLITHFKIQVSDRHRAMADTYATTILFEKILANNADLTSATNLMTLGVKESRLPHNLSIEKLSAIPDECGVYYFHNQAGDVIYVGKSKNIRRRIAEHFADHTEKASKLQQKVADVSYELLGSELIALIHEDVEIKRIKPEINKAQRKEYYPYSIQHYLDPQGYIRFDVAKNVQSNRKKLNLLGEYARLPDAKNRIKQVKYKYNLCANLCGLEYGTTACFDYKVDQCLGACCQKESFLEYNARAQEAILTLSRNLEGSFLIIEAGRTIGEKGVIWVHEGNYAGHSFVADDVQLSAANLSAQVKKASTTPDIHRIIYRYLNDQKKVKIIKLDDAQSNFGLE